MAKQKMIDDSEIIAAVLSSKSKGEAAAKVGLSSRQFYERLRNHQLQAELSQCRADVLREQLQALTDAQADAITTVREILTSDTATNSERLRAADMLLSYGCSARQEIRQADARARGRLMDAPFDDRRQQAQESSGLCWP